MSNKQFNHFAQLMQELAQTTENAGIKETITKMLSPVLQPYNQGDSLDAVLNSYADTIADSLEHKLHKLGDMETLNWNFYAGDVVKSIGILEGMPTMGRQHIVEKAKARMQKLLQERITETFQDNSWTHDYEIAKLDGYLQDLGLTREDISGEHVLPVITKQWALHPADSLQ